MKFTLSMPGLVCWAVLTFLSCSNWAADKAFLKINAFVPGGTAPVAVRAIMRDSNGSFVPGEWGNSTWPTVTIRGKAVGPNTVLELPLGPTTITVGKGPDYLPQTVTVNLSAAGQTYTSEVLLEPALNLLQRGWRGGDAHIHYFHGDSQVSRTPDEVFNLCAAAGLNFASLAGEHYGASLLTRAEALGVWTKYENSECPIWLGAEAPKSAWGHHASIAYDPWGIRETLPYDPGVQSVHAQGGVSFPVHPDRLYPVRSYGSSYSFYPLNNHFKYLPFAALAGHLLDGWSGISDQPHGAGQIDTYLKLLSMGYKIPLLTDSDYCMDRANNELKGLGFWINYVHLEGNPLSRAAVSEAIRRGRVFATTGPLVLFTVNGALPGTSFPADGAARTFRIEASYRFNPWTLSYFNFAGTEKCAISSVELLRNGHVVRQWRPNAATTLIEETLPAETQDCQYMVRVLGNEGVWMAGYSSPVYFETSPRPRQPSVFKPIINGRLYDGKTGEPLVGTVSAVRYGKTEWTLNTDPGGRFRARVPLDAKLVARDQSGRELARDWMSYEPAYAFGHYLPERYADKAPAIDDFANMVREMTWEFPIGRQSADSYVRAPLTSDGLIQEVSVLQAPPRRAGKQNTEIVMMLTDKTQVQAGDRLNYVVIYRSPDGGVPKETLLVQFGGWDPNYPRMYTRYGKFIIETRPTREPLIDLGGGFYMRQNSMVVPDWVRNLYAGAGGLRMRAVVQGFEVIEEANLTLPIGPTRRELLVSTTWDGFPGSWGGRGHGPCDFSREFGWLVRYPDYRQASVRFKLNGVETVVRPSIDTAQVADADDAIFEDYFYYDGQCEPEYRNVPFRDPIRAQPPQPDFASMPIADPADATPPTVAVMEPVNAAQVVSPVRFYYHVNDDGLSGAAGATLLVNGQPAGSGTAAVPVVLNLEPGEYTWQVQGLDRAGNSALSESRTFTVLSGSGTPPPDDPPPPPPPPPPPTVVGAATFVSDDRARGGSWKGVYGGDGYYVVRDVASYPAYVEVTPAGHTEWLWSWNETDSRALERASASTRLAACLYANAAFELRFVFKNAEQHRVAFYFLDWDNLGREQRIEFLDGDTGAVLDSRVVSSFRNGAYLSWNLAGKVTMRVTPQSGNAVVSGIFFDPPGGVVQAAAPPVMNPAGGTFEGSVNVSLSSSTPGVAIYYTLDGSTPSASSVRYTGPVTLNESRTMKAIALADGMNPSSVTTGVFTITAPPPPPPPPPPSGSTVAFHGTDLVTRGNWKGVYGGDGHWVINDSQALPSYATVLPTRKLDWVWNSATTDARALQKGKVDGRIAACWFQTDYFEAELNIQGTAPRRVALHCLDWDRAARVQRVEILDFSTRQVLHSTELQNFADGVYLKYEIQGRVLLRFTKLQSHNAVVSGLFFDATGAPAAAAPRFSPAAGTYQTSVDVSMSTATSGASIHYTVDGTTPTAQSPQYAGPVTLTSSATIEAIAIAAGMNPSPVAAAAYTISAAPPPPPPPPPPSSPVQFLGTDTATGGSWKGKYGADGYFIVSDSQSIPNYATLAATGKSDWIWQYSTTDLRLLERGLASGRIASCWYQPTSFEINLNIAGDVPRRVSLYCLDWDNIGRVQKLEVLDADTRAVLHSIDLQGFNGGVYVKYQVQGSAVIRVTKLQSHNAVVGGVFFDLAD